MSKADIPLLCVGTWSVINSHTWFAGVDPDSSLLGAHLVALGSDLLEVDNEHLGVMLCVSKEFGRV